MKPVLLIFFLLSSGFAKAQFVPKHYSGDSAYVLLADNGKHHRLYSGMRTLKIHYLRKGEIVKAKGRLSIRNAGGIQLIPFGKKDIVTIPLDSIISIMPWHRKGKTGAAIVAGTGAAAIGLAYLLASPPKPGVVEGNFVGVVLTGYAIMTLYYAVIAFSAALLGEWLFVRSIKKGYHFSIEKVALQKDLWGKVFPHDFPAYKPVQGK